MGIVPYSPLGRGFLADFEALSTLSSTDFRASHPRFTGENFEENKKRIARFYEIATKKNCTPAQLALAWLHSKGDDVFPIPGTKTSKRIEENAGAFQFAPLSPEEMAEVETVVQLVGDRSHPASVNSNYNYNSRL